MSVYLLEECTETEKKLIEAAKQATKNAYARYSNFKVGAALLLENGEVITGNNQENAAYPSGTCAERTAVFFAN
ncbi:MAG TPA: cytidine deaminase, partial [Porphyromonadaceae bacterium]|nr:cytidine deaminase [Porphyromonadaceae bacterium]